MFVEHYVTDTPVNKTKCVVVVILVVVVAIFIGPTYWLLEAITSKSANVLLWNFAYDITDASGHYR